MGVVPARQLQAVICAEKIRIDNVARPTVKTTQGRGLRRALEDCVDLADG